jgi:zinc protease
VHPFPEYKTASTGADRSKAPVPGAPPELRLPKLQRAKLSNSLQLILAERHEVPVVDFWLTADAGYAADQSAAPGTASMTSALLDGGTATRNALQISDQLAMLGAQLNATSNLDRSTVRLSALKSNLDPSLQIYADVILNPEFPEADFKRQQKQQIAGIQREENTPTQMALRIIPGLLYGQGHAYGNPLTGSGTKASVEKMTREDLVKFHRTWFRPNNSTLIIVGDTTLAEITPKLEKLFVAWKTGEVPNKNIGTVEHSPKPKVFLVDKPGALQSVIIAGDVAPPKANPNEIAIEAVNDALGGNFGSRINMNLREDKHWSYGTRSILIGAKGQRPYITIAPVQTDKTREAMEEMNKEFQGIIKDRPITPEELVKIQDNQTLSLPGSRETMNSVGESIIDLVQFGLPDDYDETYAGKVRALRIADVDNAAKEVVHPQKLIWVVVGDRAKIEAGVRELNLGEIQFLDAEGKRL